MEFNSACEILAAARSAAEFGPFDDTDGFLRRDFFFGGALEVSFPGLVVLAGAGAEAGAGGRIEDDIFANCSFSLSVVEV
mmetsp:Transcript_27976/g.41320  ORF Transcript_27976/g.41320 Transcript_27976/m.41320 type:complete len:80 (-) Transcript_27976:130-369(-)